MDDTGSAAAGLTDDIRARVRAIDWYHSIDLGGGIVTPGNPVDRDMLERGLPDLAGRTVLDIGAWDGFYSFLAERRGAARVVAMDHYAWCVDFHARLEYWQACEAAGELPDHRRDLTEFYRPDTMPGRRGFDLAREVLGSGVEPVVGDFMEVDPSTVGRFDVVLFLGVLYHLREPLTALERIRALTGGVAVIETEAVRVLGLPGARVLEFHPGGELRADHTNWFVPTEAALHALCRAAGFGRVETRIGPPSAGRHLASIARGLAHRAGLGDSGLAPAQGRAPASSPSPVFERYRIAVHAYP
jgi:tRNA (mo5U34)-methyltransferase